MVSAGDTDMVSAQKCCSQKFTMEKATVNVTVEGWQHPSSAK